MAVLTKEAILNAKDLELKELEVEEWGGSVYMGHMTLSERFKYDEGFTQEFNGSITIKDPNNPAYMLEYIRLVLKDQFGKPLLDEEDIKALLEKEAKIVLKVFKACSEHNSMQSDIDDIKKKLKTTQNEDSFTG